MPAVGQDIPHDSARGHVAGESIFIDDMPPARNELLADFLGAPVAAGKLLSIDFNGADQIPGVVALLTAKDIPGHNQFGPVMQDEHLLVEGQIDFLGDPCVLIVAEHRQAIAEAKKRITLQVEKAQPIFSIEDAIAAESFIGPLRLISRGDAEGAINEAEQTLTGEFHIGGQEHFYLESQAAIAIPGEHGHLAIHSSTQHPSETQAMVAEIVGVPFNHVVVHCKRMGGGFGGKETQAAHPAMMAALAAAKTRRPVRVVYTKDNDMRYTGKRHPFFSRWTVGFTREGLITGLNIAHYSNGGCTCDLSLAVMERAMLHTDNAYWIPNIHITGQVCRTNLPSNTAFRGFGGPQGIANIENILESIGLHLGIDAMEIRRRNLYGIDDRNVTPYGQVVKNNTLPRLFDQLETESGYRQRRRQIDAFNRQSSTHLRGLSCTGVKFGISFTKQHMNQANALVNVYIDGTVMVSTGGTEMGQGVNTRIRQIVADEFGIDWQSVYVATTSTDKNHNTSPTAASTGTDLNGAAAVEACKAIRARLANFAARHLSCASEGLAASPDNIHFENGNVYDDRVAGKSIRFKDLTTQAYLNRVNLGERGFYATPGVDYNRETGKGTPFLYYTNGAAVSEVEIDRYTGEMRVTRVDLLMDIGLPINPGLDRGQVVGGFIQGMGWCTAEELKYGAGGELLTYSPTTYKIPNISDLPTVFNVKMLDNPDNAISLKRSKAVGEPPLNLGLSVMMAVKNALSYLSPGQIPDLHLPATNEQILMLMQRSRVPLMPPLPGQTVA